MAEVDHDLPEAGVRELLEVVNDEGLAPDRDEGLGRMVGKGTEPFAVACR